MTTSGSERPIDTPTGPEGALDGTRDDGTTQAPSRQPSCTGRAAPGSRGERGTPSAVRAPRAACGAQARGARRGRRDAARTGARGETRTGHGDLRIVHGDTRPGRTDARAPHGGGRAGHGEGRAGHGDVRAGHEARTVHRARSGHETPTGHEVRTGPQAPTGHEARVGHEARADRVARTGRGVPRVRRGRREPLRRLLPQALVVACLAGGTTAFVAHDKSVQLSIDGKPRILHTFADDVAGLLEDEGVVVGTHDVVTPAPAARLSNGEKVAVRHTRPLRLTVDGRRRQVWTTASTVDGALRVLGVRPEGAYLSVSRSRHIARTGLTLTVRTERAVHVRADGHTRTVHTNAASAAAAVRAAGVRLHGRDTLSVAAGSFPRDGQTITVARVRTGRKVRSESIPYPVRRTEDPGLPRGTEVVVRHGRPGTRRVTYATSTVDGVSRPERRLDSEVVRRPRAEQVRVGTRPPAAHGSGGPGAGGTASGPKRGHGLGVHVSDRVDELDWAALARCESGGRADAVDPSGTYGGLYQFDVATWRSLGGRGRPEDAPAAEQTRLAKLLYARRGAAPWPVCGRHLTG